MTSNWKMIVGRSLAVTFAMFFVFVPRIGAGDETTPAQAAFDRFKNLQGKWEGTSTKGWKETISFKTIAAGSVVVEDSFDAHPDEAMMTMYYLDGSRLMLTHYCVAKNQPRLLATSFTDAGKTITFTFLDGTNMPTRDRGHMDKVVIRFLDQNHVTNQWTWYQNGAEKWMEEIRLVRLVPENSKQINSAK